MGGSSSKDVTFDSSMAPLHRPISRSRFLRLSAGAALGVAAGGLAAACSSDSGSSGDGGSPSGESLPAAPVSGSIGGRLDYLGWQGYDFPDQTKPWLSANGVDMKAGYIAAWPDVAAKLKAGTPIDVANGDTGFNRIFQDLGVLSRIADPSAIANLDSVSPRFLEPFTLQDGSLTGVPFTWGTFALVWNTETVQAPPTSWADLLEPEFKGRIALIDDNTYTLNLAALSRGQHDFAAQTPSQLQESIAYIEKFKNQAKTISPGWGDVITLLQNGDIDAVFGGWAALKVFVGEGVKLEVGFPTEGSVSYISTYWVPQVADNGATALGWINDTLSPDVQVEVPGSVGDATVTPAVASQLSGDLRTLYPYDDIDSFIDANPYYAIPGYKEPEGITTYPDWQAAWNQMKAS